MGLAEGVYDYEIVGVVKDGKYTGLGKRPCEWCMSLIGRVRGHRTWSFTCAPRRIRPPLATALREKVRALDETAPVFDVHTVRDDIDRSLLRERLARDRHDPVWRAGAPARGR